MQRILITSDPYLQIRDNEITMVQDVAIINRASENVFVNIEYCILIDTPINKHSSIMCFGYIPGLVKRRLS